jgi:hypothetical protein
VLVWQLVRPLPQDRGQVLLLGLAWLVPIMAMYLNVAGVGVAPLILAAVFALSVYQAVGGSPAVRSPPVPQPAT